jgi:hypothetical protein
MPWEDNVEPSIDEVWAPFPPPGSVSGEALVVDAFYGQPFNRSTMDAAINTGFTVYGSTESVFVTPDRESANDGFLRLPFRANGLCMVRSQAEFEQQLQRIRDTAEKHSSWRTQAPDHRHRQLLLFRGDSYDASDRFDHP